MIAAGSAEGSEASKNTLRNLIKTVTVFPPEPGKGVSIAVVGHLSSLIGGGHFPTNTVQGVRGVAEVRYIAHPHSADGLFSFGLAA